MKGRINLPIIALSLISFMQARQSMADENLWSTNGPYEARVFSIAIDPRDNQRIFAGTVDNGLYITSNGGGWWSRVDDDTLYTNIRDIVFHPVGPDTMYAATWSGMYRSRNGGTTWGLMRPPDSWYSQYYDIEVHPVHDSIILVGAGLATGYRSTDGGDTWNHLDLPWIAIKAIRTDPLRPDTVYVSSQSPHYGLSVMRSEDLGVSWYSIHNNLDSALFAWDLEVDPVNSDIIYLAGSRYPFTDPGICLEKTTDAGAHWFDITPNGLIEYHIWSLTISPFDNNVLYLCTRANGVMKSTDGGQNWEVRNEGLSARNVARIFIDPSTGILYLGTLYHGIFRSIDEAETWDRISDNINQAECTDMAVNPRDADTVYVATRGGVYRSIDGADNWQRLEFELPFFFTESNGVEIDPYDPNYIYVSFFDHESVGDGGIFRTTDGGESWETFTAGLPAGGFYRKMAVSNYGNASRRIFLGGIGLYYSDNLGENWQLCEGGLPSEFYYWLVETSSVDPDLVYTVNGSQTDVFYRSTDGGDNWTSLPAPPGIYAIKTITCHPANRNTVYVCKINDGLYRSTDTGESWIDITNDLPRYPDDFSVSGMAVNPLNPRNLYVNSRYMGIFVSHNGGQNWEDFNEGLDTRIYDAITIVSPSDTSHVYLATVSKSVWTITQTASSVDDDIRIPDKFIAISNYPNPFNSITIIQYSLQETAAVSLTIYDITGRKVANMLEDVREAGQHTMTWDARDFPSGVYFARLEAGDRTETIKMVLLK